MFSEVFTDHGTHAFVEEDIVDLDFARLRSAGQRRTVQGRRGRHALLQFSLPSLIHTSGLTLTLGSEFGIGTPGHAICSVELAKVGVPSLAAIVGCCKIVPSLSASEHSSLISLHSLGTPPLKAYLIINIGPAVDEIRIR